MPSPPPPPPPTNSAITGPDGTQFPFIVLRGVPQFQGQAVEEISRPGVDGHGYRLVGLRGEPFTMQAVVDSNDQAAAKLLLQSLASLQGTIVTVLDDHGRTWNNVMLLKVRPVAANKIITAVGGISTGKDHLSTIEFDMQIAKQSS